MQESSRYSISPERRDQLIKTYRRVLELDILPGGQRVCASLKEHAREALAVLEAGDVEGMVQLGVIGFLDSLPIVEGSNTPHAETLIEWLWPHVPDRAAALATLRTWTMLLIFGPEQTQPLSGSAFERHIRALDQAGLLEEDMRPEVANDRAH